MEYILCVPETNVGMKLRWVVVCAALLVLLAVLVGMTVRRRLRRKALEASRRRRSTTCRDAAANTIFVQLHGPVTEGALVRLFESAACPQRIRVAVAGATTVQLLARYAAYVAREGLPSYRDNVRGAYGGERWVLVLHASTVTLAHDWDERMVRMATDAGEPLHALAILMAGGFPVAVGGGGHGGVRVRMTRLAQQPKHITPLALFWTPQCTFSSAAAWRSGGGGVADARTGPRMWMAGVNFYLPNDASIAEAVDMPPTPVHVVDDGGGGGGGDDRRSSDAYARFVGVDFDTGEVSARAALGLVSTDVVPRLDEVLFKFGSLRAFESQRDALTTSSKVH